MGGALHIQTNQNNGKLGKKMFFGQEHPNLNEVDRDKCEGLLTEKECLEAVKSMESGKSPGTDGLRAEF